MYTNSHPRNVEMLLLEIRHPITILAFKSFFGKEMKATIILRFYIVVYK